MTYKLIAIRDDAFDANLPKRQYIPLRVNFRKSSLSCKVSNRKSLLIPTFKYEKTVYKDACLKRFIQHLLTLTSLNKAKHLAYLGPDQTTEFTHFPEERPRWPFITLITTNVTLHILQTTDPPFFSLGL